jgi:hypothetical protein
MERTKCMGHYCANFEVGLELWGGPHDEQLGRRRVRMVDVGRSVKDAAGDEIEYFTLKIETDNDSFASLRLIANDDSSEEQSMKEQEPLFKILLDDGNLERLVAALVAVRDLRVAQE